MKCDIDQAVLTVLKNPKPLLMIDTCSLLDILRTPHRSNVTVSHLVGAKDLLAKNKLNDLHLILTTTVEAEFNEHLKEVAIELQKIIQSQAAKNLALINTIEVVGLSYKFSVAGMAEIKLTEALQFIAEQFVNNALVLERDKECESLAFNRVEKYQAPAAKGKSESKDCLIVEHYLKLVSILRTKGFADKAIFITGNSNDYGNTSAPKAPLETQFAGLSIDYVNNFAWAFSTIFQVPSLTAGSHP